MGARSKVRGNIHDSCLLQVSAVDNDRGPNGVVAYSIVQGTDKFSIDSRSGTITVASDIDHEEDVSIQVGVVLWSICVFRSVLFCVLKVMRTMNLFLTGLASQLRAQCLSGTDFLFSFVCCHTDIEFADRTCFLNLSLY